MALISFAPQRKLPTPTPLDCGNCDEGKLCAEVTSRLQAERIAYVRGFPVTSGNFIHFLSLLGRPLLNYASTLASSAGTAEDFINRVCFKNDRAEFGFQAEGPLAIHTARSWRMPPPTWFSLLMVDKGDQRPGKSGASQVLRFRDALKWLEEKEGVDYPDVMSQLKGIRIALPARKVPEPPLAAPIVFSLGTPDPFDLGIRFRADIEAVAGPQLLALPQSVDALARLVNAINNCDAVYEFQMEPGDLLILDNRRFGHGRANAEREGFEGTVNSREVWSATID